MQIYCLRLFSVCSIISLSARCSCKKTQATCTTSQVDLTSPNHDKTQPACTTKRQAQEDLINQFLEDTNELNLNRFAKSGGIAFVVLSRYQGELSVLLGRERAGCYTGKLNFIGGKVERTSSGYAPLMKVIATLYEEVYEELGISLVYNAFKKSLIGLEAIVSKTHNTMICFCHLSDIVIQNWTDMDTKRKQQGVAWAYQEFSEIAYVPINDLEARSMIFLATSMKILHELKNLPKI